MYVATFPDLSGGKWLISTEGGVEPVWASDGSELFYRDRAGTMVATRWSPSGGVLSVERLFDTRPFHGDPVHATYAVHPDGRFLMVELAENPETGLGWIEGFSTLLDESRGRE